MPSRYAAATEVPVQRSKAIETLLVAHGAKAFTMGWNESHDTLQFKLFDRAIRFVLPRPAQDDYRVSPQGYIRSVKAQQAALEQADRQRWRALYLVIRAKIEAVEAGIAVFEQEFLAFIVTGSGMTVGDILVPQIKAGGELRMLQEGAGHEAAND